MKKSSTNKQYRKYNKNVPCNSQIAFMIPHLVLMQIIWDSAKACNTGFLYLKDLHLLPFLIDPPQTV